MLQTRVIPCLLLRNGGLVKTVKFTDPKYVGDPINAVRIFNDKEVDELVFLDIGATTSGKGPNFGLLADIASEAFMPFAYGGGITTADQVKQLFALGVEKLSVQTTALRDFAGRQLEHCGLRGCAARRAGEVRCLRQGRPGRSEARPGRLRSGGRAARSR